MMYFKLISDFEQLNGNPGQNILVQQCEDVDYQKTIDESIIVSRAIAKRICNGTEPLITNTIINLTLAQYNQIIKVTPEPLDADIAALEDELNQTQNDTITEE